MPIRATSPGGEFAGRARDAAEGLAARVATRRTRASMSQADLGAAIGYSGAWVSNVESGITIPRADLLAALAGALGTSVGELLGEETGEAEVLERAIPGWSRLDPAQQENVRGIVRGLANAPALEPEASGAVARMRAELDARADADRRAAGNPAAPTDTPQRPRRGSGR